MGNLLMGGKRLKGESLDQYNQRAAKEYQKEWEISKKLSGKWLPKEEYEKTTGRPGKK